MLDDYLVNESVNKLSSLFLHEKNQEVIESSIYLYIKGSVLNELPLLMPNREAIAKGAANAAIAQFRLGIEWHKKHGID